MNYTENLHLLKPETSELFDVQHANSNAEILDAAIALKASLEQVATMLEEIIETGEITEVDIGAVTTIREFIDNTGFRVGVGTNAQIAAAQQAGSIPNHALVIPTDGSDVTEFERMSALTADTGWVTLPASAFASGWTPSGAGVQVRKIGNHVFIRGRATLDSEATTGDYHNVLTIPAAYRPPTANLNRVNCCTDHTFVELIVNNSTLAENPGVLWTYRVIDSSFTTGFVTLAGKTLMIDLDYFLD